MTHNDLFRLFVYGTLKRGYSNHERFCRSMVSIQEATVRGRLYEMPSGIPVLRIPDQDTLARGTANALADATTQNRIRLAAAPDTLDEWLMIRGELLVLSNPSRDVPPIDRLESYRPGLFSLYHRVLVPVTTADDGIIAAWTYVGAHDVLERCIPLEETIWL